MLTLLGQYLDQQGFNPFGINPAGLFGLGSGAKTGSESTSGAIRAFGEEIAGKVETKLPKGTGTAVTKTPLSGPTENWQKFLQAEKQIQLDASSSRKVDQVIGETLSGKKNFTSSTTLTTDEALAAGQKYLGSGYKEIGKPGSGVFHSADGTKEFRIDSGSISGAHAPGVPHVHFGVKDTMTGKYISNNHVPYLD